MKEYEISNNNKVIGKVKTFKNKYDFKNTIIESNRGLKYSKLNDENNQTYEIEYTVDNVDDLFDIVSKFIYNNEEVFDYIENVKKENNIKTIKKDTKIKLLVPVFYLEKLNISLDKVDYKSLINAKVYFIKKVLETNNDENIKNNVNTIINEYNNFINSSEYEFLTDEEKDMKNKHYINRLDNIVKVLENNTNYKYGKNYIIPIKISNN